MSKKIVFIESNTTGTGVIFAKQSYELGYQPVLITSNINRYSKYFKKNTKVINANTNNLNEILKVCQKLHKKNRGLVGITSTSQYYIHASSIIAKKLGLSGPDPKSVEIASNKYLQRKKLKQNNISIPTFFKVKNSKEAIQKAKQIGYPVIVKPVLASGSEGVKLCQNTTEVKKHTKKLLKIKKNPRGQKNPDYILVEENVKGQEYSAETLGDGKSIHLIGITKKYLSPPPNFLEIGHDYPAQIKEEIKKSLSDLTISALKATGLTWGPAHTEIRLTADGPKIIEINPRLAGGMIPEMIRLSQDINLILEILKLICRNKFIKIKFTQKFYTSIRFIIPTFNDKIKTIKGVDEARKIPFVEDIQIYEKYKKFNKLKGDFNDRIGHIIAKAKNLTETRDAAESALKKIKIERVKKSEYTKI